MPNSGWVPDERKRSPFETDAQYDKRMKELDEREKLWRGFYESLPVRRTGFLGKVD